jgi:hypothetical protein
MWLQKKGNTVSDNVKTIKIFTEPIRLLLKPSTFKFYNLYVTDTYIIFSGQVNVYDYDGVLVISAKVHPVKEYKRIKDVIDILSTKLNNKAIVWWTGRAVITRKSIRKDVQILNFIKKILQPSLPKSLFDTLTDYQKERMHYNSHIKKYVYSSAYVKPSAISTKQPKQQKIQKIYILNVPIEYLEEIYDSVNGNKQDLKHAIISNNIYFKQEHFDEIYNKIKDKKDSIERLKKAVKETWSVIVAKRALSELGYNHSMLLKWIERRIVQDPQKFVKSNTKEEIWYVDWNGEIWDMVKHLYGAK